MKRAKIPEKLAATNDAVNKDAKEKETTNEETATEEAGLYFNQILGTAHTGKLVKILFVTLLKKA